MKKSTDFLEAFFENLLFGCRWFVLLAVLGSLFAAILTFLKGGFAIAKGAISFFSKVIHFEAAQHGPPEMVLYFINAVDSFLFATVLLIFSMGIYELFVSKIDTLSNTPEDRKVWLQVTSLEDLKGYIGKVILMILIVNFFEQSFHLTYSGPLDLLCLSGGIVLIALSLFLTHGKVHSTKMKEAPSVSVPNSLS